MTKEKMQKTLEAFDRELKTIRTGRPNPSILDRVSADYYGVQTPIKNMANISILDGRSIEIKPFDKGSIKLIEKAIQDSDLGFTPNNDGTRILINVPELTKERREQLAKLVKKQAEEAKVSVRNIRRDEMELIKKLDGGSEDEKKKLQDDIQKITDEFIKKIDELSANKEKEILTI